MIILSGEIYGGVATHHLRVAHCTMTHNVYIPVDDVSKGTMDLSIIQFVANVTVYRIFTSTALHRIVRGNLFHWCGRLPESTKIHSFSSA
jgi:hypothetical protein